MIRVMQSLIFNLFWNAVVIIKVNDHIIRRAKESSTVMGILLDLRLAEVSMMMRDMVKSGEN